MSCKCFIRSGLCIAFALAKRDASEKVVFYHDIGRKWTSMGTGEDVFWAHMGKIRKGDVVCFDDGFRGVWDARWMFARKKVDVRKIVFLAVGLVGRPGYLTWDEARAMQNEFGFEFQCHTWSHQTLAGPWNDEEPIPEDGRTEEWFRHELVDAKNELEKQLERPVASLCLPVGHYSNDVLRRCRNAGYKKVYASLPGNATTDFLQPRCLVQDLSPLAFAAVLNGGMMVFENRYRRRQLFSDNSEA